VVVICILFLFISFFFSSGKKIKGNGKNQIKSNNCSCSSSSNHISQKQQLLLWSVESQAPEQSAVEVMRRAHLLLLLRPVRLAYQPPASSTFLSEQTSHQQPASSTLLSGQTSTSHQPTWVGWSEHSLLKHSLLQCRFYPHPSLPFLSFHFRKFCSFSLFGDPSFSYLVPKS
jgi:hypothetical protein